MQYRRLFILLLLAGLLAATASWDPVHGAVSRLLEAARPIIAEHAVTGFLLFVVLSAVSGVLVFFSTLAIVPVAVYAWGKPATIVILWASWLLGAVLSYWVGRRPGRRLAGWVGSKQGVARYEKKISARANFPLVLLFQLAVPSEIPGLVLGAVRYDFRRYLWARAIAEVPFAVGTVYLSETFVRRQYLPLLAIAVGGAILASAALHLLQKRIEQ